MYISNRLNYQEFYEELWMSEDYIDIISDDFIDNEKEFIREWTYQVWRQYDLRFDSDNPMEFKTIKKMFGITFATLASFSPRTDKIKPISDKGRY